MHSHPISIPSYWRPRQRQQGVVILIALIALVVMTLAALGFMRAVDTGKLLAGNMAFNRAAVALSDSGMEAARAAIATLDNATTSGTCGLSDTGASCLWLNGTAIAALASPPAATPPSNGYYAAVDPTFDYRTTDWSNAYSLTTGGLTTSELSALNGYDVRYIVHRMCDLTGDPRLAHCITQAALGGQSKGSVEYGNSLTQTAPDNPVYRITVRVTGPRNSLSYIQIWMS